MTAGRLSDATAMSTLNQGATGYTGETGRGHDGQIQERPQVHFSDEPGRSRGSGHTQGQLPIVPRVTRDRRPNPRFIQQLASCLKTRSQASTSDRKQTRREAIIEERVARRLGMSTIAATIPIIVQSPSKKKKIRMVRRKSIARVAKKGNDLNEDVIAVGGPYQTALPSKVGFLYGKPRTNLVVGPSTINAGMNGLFWYSPDKKSTGKDSIKLATYEGAVSTIPSYGADVVMAYRQDDTPIYVTPINDCYGRYANDGFGWRCNGDILFNQRTNKVEIWSIPDCDIPHLGEILIPYGAEYWRHHLYVPYLDVPKLAGYYGSELTATPEFAAYCNREFTLTKEIKEKPNLVNKWIESLETQCSAALDMAQMIRSRVNAEVIDVDREPASSSDLSVPVHPPIVPPTKHVIQQGHRSNDRVIQEEVPRSTHIDTEDDQGSISTTEWRDEESDNNSWTYDRFIANQGRGSYIKTTQNENFFIAQFAVESDNAHVTRTHELSQAYPGSSVEYCGPGARESHNQRSASLTGEQSDKDDDNGSVPNEWQYDYRSESEYDSDGPEMFESTDWMHDDIQIDRNTEAKSSRQQRLDEWNNAPAGIKEIPTDRDLPEIYPFWDGFTASIPLREPRPGGTTECTRCWELRQLVPRYLQEEYKRHTREHCDAYCATRNKYLRESMINLIYCSVGLSEEGQEYNKRLLIYHLRRYARDGFTFSLPRIAYRMDPNHNDTTVRWRSCTGFDDKFPFGYNPDMRIGRQVCTEQIYQYSAQGSPISAPDNLFHEGTHTDYASPYSEWREDEEPPQFTSSMRYIPYPAQYPFRLDPFPLIDPDRGMRFPPWCGRSNRRQESTAGSAENTHDDNEYCQEGTSQSVLLGTKSTGTKRLSPEGVDKSRSEDTKRSSPEGIERFHSKSTNQSSPEGTERFQSEGTTRLSPDDNERRHSEGTTGPELAKSSISHQDTNPTTWEMIDRNVTDSEAWILPHESEPYSIQEVELPMENVSTTVQSQVSTMVSTRSDDIRQEGTPTRQQISSTRRDTDQDTDQYKHQPDTDTDQQSATSQPIGSTINKTDHLGKSKKGKRKSFTEMRRLSREGRAESEPPREGRSNDEMVMEEYFIPDDKVQEEVNLPEDIPSEVQKHPPKRKINMIKRNKSIFSVKQMNYRERWVMQYLESNEVEEQEVDQELKKLAAKARDRWTAIRVAGRRRGVYLNHDESVQRKRVINLVKKKIRLAKKRSSDNPSVFQAKKRPDWHMFQAAIDSELQQMVDEGVMDEMIHYQRKECHNLLGTMMVLQIKRHQDGTIDKYKARLVALGNQQTPSSYHDIRSGTARSATVKLLMSIQAKKGCASMVLDVKGAYLKSPIVEEKNEHLYLRLLDGRIMKLKKYLYGLKQAGYEWENNVTACLIENGYTRCISDPRAFTKKLDQGEFINMCIHVDDFFVIASSTKLLTDLHDLLTRKYGTVTIKKGDLLEYLGMQINILPNGSIKLTQPFYSKRITEEFLTADEIARCGKTKTPVSSIGLAVGVGDDEPIDQTFYLRIVGSLSFLAQYTRADLLYAMSLAAQRCSNPTRRDLRFVRRILLYVANTIDYGIIFSTGDIELSCYCDAAHHSYEDGKGHYGYMCSLGDPDGAFFAVSKKAKLTTLSSTETEYVALCEATKEVVWLRRLLEELGWKQKSATVIWEDNQSTIDQVHGHMNFQSSKHINPKFHFTGEQYELGEIEVVHCPTDEMLADFLTKGLASGPFRGFASATLNLDLYPIILKSG